MSTKPMLTTAQALEALLSAAKPLQRFDVIPTEDALGRVLAEDIASPIDVPPVDVSAMDGYAVRLADVTGAGADQIAIRQESLSSPAPASAPASASAPAFLPISQRIPAGSFPAPLTAGTAARIFTGAPLPEGADAVIMQEEARAQDDGVTFAFEQAPNAGQWINRRGADIRAGSVILAAGSRLTPQSLGLAASVGVAQIKVAGRLKVAMVFTGDELRRPGEPLSPGAIYNSNRYTLGGLLTALGCDVTDYGIVEDRLDATRDALRTAAAGHDVVITSGGVSVGEEDHVKAAVEAEGSLALWKIAMKPGKPLAFGTLRRVPLDTSDTSDTSDGPYFIGLPGNPVSTLVTFLIFVRPFLLRLQGATMVAPRVLQARADFALKGDRRNEFLRVKVNENGGLDLFPTQSSAVLTSAVWGDGLVDNPPDRSITSGDLVRYIPFADLLY